MSKNINSYLPKVLQNILELTLTNESLDVELDDINLKMSNILEEVIVSTSTLYGIERWEKALLIKAKESESIRIRRFRIQTILTNKIPYTIRWLYKKLEQITGSANAWTVDVYYSEYKVVIKLATLDLELMGEIEQQLRQSIPSNMALEIGSETTGELNFYAGCGTFIGYKLKFES